MNGRLRVAIDATAIPANRVGVGRYVDSLVAALARLDLDVVVVAQPGDVERYRQMGDIEVVTGPAAIGRRAVRLVWEQVGLPGLARSVGADVLHSPHYTMPRPGPYARVVTLHDATFFSDPHLHTSVKARFFPAAIRRAVRSEAELITVSLASATELARHTDCRADRFHVVHHGVDHDVFHPVGEAERTRVAASLGLAGRSYVAFLGTLEPRKNVPALIRAWVEVAERFDDPPALVLAGGRGWDPEVDRALAEVPARLTALAPGYLPLDDLAGFLGGAVVLAYPSLGEGFGLPVVEAMACGATVLTTRMLALPEVGGDAVAYCGTSSAEIRDALALLLKDGPGRAALAQAALLRGASFTWESAAQAHLAVYREAAQRRRRAG